MGSEVHTKFIFGLLLVIPKEVRSENPLFFLFSRLGISNDSYIVAFNTEGATTGIIIRTVGNLQCLNVG